jgi:hypothetical protein
MFAGLAASRILARKALAKFFGAPTEDLAKAFQS